MNEKKLKKKIKRLEEVLSTNKNTAKKELKILKGKLDNIVSSRWRADMNGTYFYVMASGHVTRDSDWYAQGDMDKYGAGNYFQTEEEARESTIYHLLINKYFYWFPTCPVPQDLPEGCKVLLSNGGGWVTELDGPKSWHDLTRRWRK